MSDNWKNVVTDSRLQRTDEEEHGDKGASREIWLYTNRLNLLEFLSSRLIKPYAGFVKYYRDASSLTKGVVPLFSSPPSQALIDGESGADYGTRPPPGVGPVALQFSPSKLAIDPTTSKSWMHGVALMPDVIPLHLVEAIHFPDSGQLNEHRARTFSGVPKNGPPLVVSPHLFQPGAEALGPEDLQKVYLDSEFRGRESTPLERYLQLDSLAGGFMMALYGSAEEPQPVSMSGVETFESGVRFLADRLLGTDSTRAIDNHLLRTIVETITQIDRQVDIASTLVDAIRRTLAHRLEGPAIGITEEYLRGIDMVLDGDRSVRPFAPGGLASGKALLLFLLDPAISAVQQLDHHRLGPDATTVAIAKVLLGLRTGRSRLPEAYRPERLEELIVELECSLLNGAGGKATASKSQRTVNAPELATADITMLLEQFQDAAPKNARTRAEARRIVTLMGWDDCATTTVYGTVANREAMSNGVKFSGIPRVVTRLDYARLRDRLMDHHSVEPAEVSHLFLNQAEE